MMVSGYFQNEQGDYTLTVNEQPVGYVKEEDHAKCADMQEFVIQNRESYVV